MEYLGPSKFQPVRVGPDPNELGYPVPIGFVVGRNEVLAVGLTAFIAYHNGFAFDLVMVFTDPENRLSPLSSMNSEMLAAIKGEEPPEDDKRFRLKLSFADGAFVDSAPRAIPRTSVADPEATQSARLSLTLLQGSGGGIRSELSWFVAPLPTPGPIQFSCEWPLVKMNFQSQLNSADQIRGAASKSSYLVLGPGE